VDEEGVPCGPIRLRRHGSAGDWSGRIAEIM